MQRATSRRSVYSRQATSDFYMVLAVLGLPMMVLLYWLLQQTNPNWSQALGNLFSAPWQTNQAINSKERSMPVNSVQVVNGRQVKVLAVTHQAICEPGRDSLNIRPTAGFQAPIAKVPCGNGVAVTGGAVTNQGEAWLPVVYGNTQGWSVSRLLRKL